MDLCDGSVFHFSQRARTASCRLIDGAVIDFNVLQRVPFEIDKDKSVVPRDVLLATLANPAVHIITKALLFQMLPPDDCFAVYLLERRWSVRAAYVMLRPEQLVSHAVNDRNGIVQAQAVQRCTDSNLLISKFPLFSRRMRIVALTRITDVKFLLDHVDVESAVVSLGEVGAKKELRALPPSSPGWFQQLFFSFFFFFFFRLIFAWLTGFYAALSACGEVEMLLSLLEEQKKTHSVSTKLIEALVDCAGWETLTALYPDYVSESQFLLDVAETKASATAQKKSVGLKGLDVTSLLFGAALAAVAAVGLLGRK
jgi:hypothetical protein